MDFQNKVVIITGASSGIGEAASIKFAELSAKVVLTGRNLDKLKATAKIVESRKGIKPLIVQADLTKDAEVKNIVDQTMKTFGRIDILVNNAGAGVIATIKDGIEPIDQMYQVNLRSTALLTHYAAPHIIKTKGNIVNVSSIGAIGPVIDFMPYCVAKAGLDMFTRAVALDLARNGVRVNSVNPCATESEFHNRLGLETNDVDDMMKARENRTALGKICTSEEVADLILFLASDKAKSITGAIYVIDNGSLLK